MKYKVAELEGPQLDAAYLIAGGFAPANVRLRDGRCEVYDNPCGGPGPCWGWYVFSADKFGDESGEHGYFARTYLRHWGMRWKGDGGMALIAAMRAYVASKFGEEVDI